jgi:hypothetical protein
VLQRVDRGINRRQLTLEAVTPEAQHPQLAMLMTPQGIARGARVAAATERGEHGKMLPTRWF